MNDDRAVDSILESIARLSRLTATRRSDASWSGHSLIGYIILKHLADTPGSSASELIERHPIDKAQASRTIAELERRDLLRRERDTDNHRIQRLWLTEAGDGELEAIIREQRAAITKRIGEWSTEELSAFSTLFADFTRSPA